MWGTIFFVFDLGLTHRMMLYIKQILMGICFPNGRMLYDLELYVAKCQVVAELFEDDLELLKYFLTFDTEKCFEIMEYIFDDESLFEAKTFKKASNEEEEKTAQSYAARLQGFVGQSFTNRSDGNEV